MVLGSTRRRNGADCSVATGGHLSPSVSRDELARFPVPQGTFQCLRQDIERCIVVPVQHYATAMTDMGTHAQTLLNERTASATLLACELRRDGNHQDALQGRIVADPLQERSPSSVINGLGQMTIVDQVADLKVLVGNQIVR